VVTTDDLSAIASQITEARELLSELYTERAYAVEAAIADGMSLRDIGAALGITHVAVRKIITEQEALRDIWAIIQSR
jgi:DNA-binding NarL/FixJ family response regulator